MLLTTIYVVCGVSVCIGTVLIIGALLIWYRTHAPRYTSQYIAYGSHPPLPEERVGCICMHTNSTRRWHVVGPVTQGLSSKGRALVRAAVALHRTFKKCNRTVPILITGGQIVPEGDTEATFYKKAIQEEDRTVEFVDIKATARTTNEEAMLSSHYLATHPEITCIVVLGIHAHLFRIQHYWDRLPRVQSRELSYYLFPVPSRWWDYVTEALW